MSRIEELEKQLTELDERKVALQKELELEKQKTEIEYSFKNGEKYFVLCQNGLISDYLWDGSNFDKTRYSQGNMFKTEEEAAKERDRRLLLTRFRQFRDKCNGDWKPDFEDCEADKYSIHFRYRDNKFYIFNSGYNNTFRLFGYFKKQEDVERAIELFGDEIKRLYVED